MLSNKNNRFLVILIAVVMTCGLLASGIQTSGGRVVITDIKIPTQNGQWVVGDLFKPRSATAENPAPLVVVVPVAESGLLDWAESRHLIVTKASWL